MTNKLKQLNIINSRSHCGSRRICTGVGV